MEFHSDCTALEAEHIYLLISKDRQLTRNVRAEWFFNHLGSTVKVRSEDSADKDDEEDGEDVEVVSVIPRDPPQNWNLDTSPLFPCKVTPTTHLTFMSHQYCLVFCLDLSPSVTVVDIQNGELMIDQVMRTLKRCLESLARPFYIPGSKILFEPRLYVSVIAHIPFCAFKSHQVLVQGWRVTSNSLNAFLECISNKLLEVEDNLAEALRTTHGKKLSLQKQGSSVESSVDEQRIVPLPTSHTDFVTLLRFGILSLHLLPDNSSMGIVVVSDSVIAPPDMSVIDPVLVYLRSSTISFSLLQLGSPFHPHCCLGFIPYPDVMEFLAAATSGAYFPKMPECDNCLTLTAMNVYHKAFFTWSFQWESNHDSKWLLPTKVASSDVWATKNQYFYTYKPTPLLRKNHIDSNIHTSLPSVLSCRFQEGYLLKEVLVKDNHIQVVLVLPWKHNVIIEYNITALWPANPLNQSCHYEVFIEGTYDFLRDYAYHGKKTHCSLKRSAVIKNMWSVLHGISQTDQLLVHLHSLSLNTANYSIPESIKSGIPLFNVSANCNSPHLHSNDVTHPQFQAFWKPICMLDINIWQKWMHVYRFGLILEFDRPLPKYLHLPMPSGRYHIIQCRQAVAAVHNLLTEWCSFVLVENHFYIKFSHSEVDKPPRSFFVIRVTSKPPSMVIHLAFLSGTPNYDRKQILNQLREKMLTLSIPQRPVIKDSMARKGLVSSLVDRDDTDSKASLKRGSSQITCCKLLRKPLDKIICRYDRLPTDYFDPMTTQPHPIINGTKHTPVPSLPKSASNLTSILHQYLKHNRWIWAVQSGTACPVALHAVDRILSTLAKLRLREGFSIAHSNSGMLNLVLELDMKSSTFQDVHKTKNATMTEDSEETCCCIVQYILFPPHSTTTSVRESISEDEAGNEIEAMEADGELQLVTECWTEPQTGFVTNSPIERKYFEGLDYNELSKMFYDQDLECVATMVTFEHLSLLCQNPEAAPPVPHSYSLSTGESSIQCVPFTFDLMRLIPKCQQTEMLFSTYIQDLSYAMPLPTIDENADCIPDVDAPNKLLMDLIFENLSRVNDKEIFISQADNISFPRQIQTRHRDLKNHPYPFGYSEHYYRVLPNLKSPNKSEQDTSPLRQQANITPRWKCFIKGISSTHILLTFIPASFHDLKVLAFSESGRHLNDGRSVHYYQDSDESASAMDATGDSSFGNTCSMDSLHKLNKSNSSGEVAKPDLSSTHTAAHGSIILPIYIYDCPLAGLINHLVYPEETKQFKDVFLDQTFKPKMELGEDTVTLRSDTQSSEGSKQTSPEPHSEDSNESPDKIQLKQHSNDIEMVFSKCFVVGVFRSLHLNHKVHVYDVQSAVDGVCEESLLEIDISNYIQTVCEHVREFKVNTALERVCFSNLMASQQLLNSSIPKLERDDSSEDFSEDRKRLSVGTDKFLLSVVEDDEHCEASQPLHTQIKSKFTSIIRKSFIPVPSNPDFFFYCPPNFQRTAFGSKSEIVDVSNSDDDSVASEDDRGTRTFKSETVEFRSEHGSVSAISKKARTDEFITEHNSGTPGFAGSQASMMSNVDSNSMCSILNDVCDHHEDNEDNIPPLFIHLTCTMRIRNNMGNCSVRCIPTCLYEILACLENPVSDVDLSDLHVTLDITCLTLSPNMDSLLSGKSQPLRTTSFCSVSPLPTEHHEMSDMPSSLHSSSEDIFPTETHGDQLSHLPDFQHQAVTKVVEEIKWMIRDEIASAMLGFFPLTEAMIDMVASHVQSSPGRPGCVVEEVPLQFVFGPDQSLDKFIEEFRCMSLTGFHLAQGGEYYYLVISRQESFERAQSPVPLTNKFFALSSDFMDDGLGRHDFESSGVPLCVTSDDGGKRLRKESGRNRNSSRRSKLADVGKQDSVRGEDSETEEPRPRSKSDVSGYRQHLLRMSKDMLSNDNHQSTVPCVDRTPFQCEIYTPLTEQYDSIQDSLTDAQDLDKERKELEGQDLLNPIQFSEEALIEQQQTTESHNPYDSLNVDNSANCASAPGLSSDVSSVIESGQCSITEDGYDGDSSDVDNESDWLREAEMQRPRLPKFWLILKVLHDRVNVYFHTRDTEETDIQLQNGKEVYRQVIKNIRNICKVVNQTLLLQDLHDTRMCNQLLEPEANEDIWKYEDSSKILRSHSLHACPPLRRDRDLERNVDESGDYLKANMDFMPGAFACKVVWQTHFVLHPRLKTGPGRTGISRGIQALRTVLNPFSVNNRENMFVYVENSGAVFYLRLSESQCPAHGSHSHGLDSTPVSRSSSVVALPQKKTNEDEDLSEPRPRVNSLSDREPLVHDTASIVSRMSGSRLKTEDSIQLLIHGISEAGPDVKEDLVQVLQNRLDEAVLDVISVTLSRNPMCKLTLEDVQFIQKTNEHPKTVIQFTIPAHALPYLLALSSYLRQNLLQFLHTPKFIDNKAESHFQDYNPNGGETRLMKEGDVFLYNRPQGSGNKGIALISFSLVDGQGNPVEHVSCTRPSPVAYKDNLCELDFEVLTSTSLYVAEMGNRPGPVALIQLRIWERGKVELELLADKLKSAVRFSLWDIVMEYRLLTAPLTEGPSFEEITVCSEPVTPVKLKIPSQDPLKDRGASPLTVLMQPAAVCSVPTTPQPLAPSCKEPEVPIAMEADILHQQEKYEVGDKGTLHPVYSCVMKDWAEFAVKLKVPTVSVNPFSVMSRYAMDSILREFKTIVANLVPDTTLKTFCKTTADEKEFYVPHTIAQRERRLEDHSPDENSAALRPLPGSCNFYMIVGRDIKQWRTSVSCLEDTGDAATHQLYRYCQRFSPVTALTERPEGSSFWSPTTNNATPIVTPSGPTSVGSCSSLLFSDSFNIFIPRQRLLLVTVTDVQLCIYTYNWAADHAASLINATSRLVQWHNARSRLLSSLVLQKMGLFHNQPFCRRSSQPRSVVDKRLPPINPFLHAAYENELLKLTSPPSRDNARKPLTSMSAFTFSEVWLDSKPPRPIHKTPYICIRDPVSKAGRQMQDTRIVDRREMQKKMAAIIQCSSSPGNVSLTEESLLVLKQFSRIEHYCLTPLLFMPQWRWQLAASRDHTILGPDSLSNSPNRSSHSSGSSIKGIDSRGRRQSINLPVMQVGQNSPKPGVTHHRNLSEETWHYHLSNNYIQEFVQYLQNLGFVPLQARSSADKTTSGGIVDDSEDLKNHLRSALSLISRSTSAKKCNTNSYVQKSYLGSLILLELSLVEPYFCMKMYGIEGGRLQSHFKSGVRRYNSQSTLTFADECDKLKVLIHLHSFTYDYHLRSIHSYISGRQLIFRQGYHLTSFLDDFVKYYQKSPNFSWNLIYQGILRVEDATTSPTQLYNHLLAHDKLYGMQVLRMIPVLPDEREVDNEYVLVQLRTQKVSYQDSNEIRRTDDFDIDLLISHDMSAYPWGTENSLVLKYYIILTSRRELYPRLAMEKKLGKFRTVATATPMSSRKVSLVSMDRPDIDKLVTPGSSRKVSLSSSESDLPNPERDFDNQSSKPDSLKDDVPLIESSSLPNACMPTICIEEERSDSASAASDTESTFSVHQMSGTFTSRSHLGIRQEAVNYLGYFSTTEELMNQIMVEQAHTAKSHIEKILETATVRCRRDSLWKRLLVGVRDNDDSRRRRDDHKETQNVGVTFKEFTDLLSLVTVTPLNEIDPQLSPFLNMHISWHQSLVKVLTAKYANTHRYFVSPDGATQYVVVLNPSYLDTFMLLATLSSTHQASLAAVFREPAPTLEHTPQRPNFHAQATKWLIEDVVNTCCFHLWSCIL